MPASGGRGWPFRPRLATTVDGVQPPQPGLPGTTPPPPAKPRNQRLRLFLALGAGILGLLCLGGVAVVVSLYDEATEIKRSSPAVVAENFLRAYLINRNDQEVSLYRCDAGGDFAQLETFRSSTESTEREFSVGVRVTWTSFEVQTTGDQATVSTDLIRTLSDNSERDAKRWQLKLVDQDGWRVCAATEQP
jgi:hypothetical protein